MRKKETAEYFEAQSLSSLVRSRHWIFVCSGPHDESPDRLQQIGAASSSYSIHWRILRKRSTAMAERLSHDSGMVWSASLRDQFGEEVPTQKQTLSHTVHLWCRFKKLLISWLKRYIWIEKCPKLKYFQTIRRNLKTRESIEDASEARSVYRNILSLLSSQDEEWPSYSHLLLLLRISLWKAIVSYSSWWLAKIRDPTDRTGWIFTAGETRTSHE